MAVQLILLYNVINKVKINYLRSNRIYLGLKKIMAWSALRTVWTNVLWWLKIKLTDGLCKRSIFWKIRNAANWIQVHDAVFSGNWLELYIENCCRQKHHCDWNWIFLQNIGKRRQLTPSCRELIFPM